MLGGADSRILALPMRVQRNVQVWFTPRDVAYGIDCFPAFFVDRPDCRRGCTAFPTMAWASKLRCTDSG
jgi:hypothetical protein